MKKRMLSVVLIFVLTISLLSVNAVARVSTVSPKLSFSGTTANCRVSVYENNKDLDITLELWQGNTLVDSWSGFDKTRLIITGSHKDCVSSKVYTVKVTGTIGGTAISSNPVSVTCP